MATSRNRAERIRVGEHGSVSALLLEPPDPTALFVFAHGAGAGMRHPFLEQLAQRLAARSIATLRYQFPYMEPPRSRRPDPPGLLTATVRAAVSHASNLVPGLPRFAGGKSLGGRMTSTAAADGGLPELSGLVFFGFPLHPPGKPATTRAAHLDRVSCPMLFLAGTRDAFADLALLVPVCRRLGARARLHTFQGADHSFRVPKRSGRTDGAVLEELVDTTVSWVEEILGGNR